jgi:signal peptidase I
MKEKKQTTADFPTLEILKQELNRERYRRRFRRILKSTVNSLIVVAAVAALIATLVLPVLQIAGTSMEPSLNDGDIVVLMKTVHLDTGDLCAFYYSNKILIKRIIAGPGDYLWITEDGTVYLNGSELIEPYISQKSLGECDIEFPYTVHEEAYFLMGDHRLTSIDSRSTVIGCIPKDQIIGKLFFKIWPLEKFEFFK